MASNVRNMKLTSVDDLFSSEASRQAEQQQQGEQVLNIPISEVHDFANNPYHVRKDAELMDMVESIQRVGVHTPCIARPRAEGGYELLSGHRRKLASTLAGSQIRQTEERICGYEQDIARLDKFAMGDDQKYLPMTIGGIQYVEKEFAGKALLDACKAKTSTEPAAIGEYRGFTLTLSFDTFSKAFQLTLKNVLSHSITLGSDVYGNISRIDNSFSGLPEKMELCKRGLEDLLRQVEEGKLEVDKPFAQEQELAEKASRLAELDALLNMEKGSPEMLDGEPEQEDEREIEYISR